MLWFLIGFIFGVFVAQESPTFPNVKLTSRKITTFFLDIVLDDKKRFVGGTNTRPGVVPQRSKSD
jgi:hypothetical protein